MNPLIIGSIFDLGKSIIERLAPDQNAKAKAEADLLTLINEQEFKTVLAQIDVNAREAQNPNVWVSGWRPYFGWIGGTAFLYATLIRPILCWVASIKGIPQPPEIDTDLLWVVVSGLLGIGSLRTIEKARKVAK